MKDLSAVHIPELHGTPKVNLKDQRVVQLFRQIYCLFISVRSPLGIIVMLSSWHKITNENAFGMCIT